MTRAVGIPKYGTQLLYFSVFYSLNNNYVSAINSLFILLENPIFGIELRTEVSIHHINRRHVSTTIYVSNVLCK